MDVEGQISVADSAGGSGTVEVDSTGVLAMTGSLYEGAGGSISVQGGGLLNPAGSVLAMGTVQLHDGTISCLEVDLGQAATLTGSGTIVGDCYNVGSVVIPAAETLKVSGPFYSTVGTVSGTGTLEMTPGHVLQASGTIDAGVVLMASELRPSAFELAPPAGAQRARTGANAIPRVLDVPPVRLRVTGDLTMNGDCTTTLRIGSQASGLRDTLTTDSYATLSGTLNLFTIAGSEPAAGDTIVVLEADTVLGTFSSVRINGVDPFGAVTLEYSDREVRVIFVRSVLGVGDDGPRPTAATELRFFPVRASGTAAFALELPERSRVKLCVFDVSGREVSRLADEVIAAGRREFRVPAGQLASGMYFARVEVATARGPVVRTARAAVVR
jgi:hypothetical protein